MKMVVPMILALVLVLPIGCSSSNGGEPASDATPKGGATGVDAGPPPTECSALAPAKDHLFALSACEGIGLGTESVCLFRQDNCSWTMQCGADISSEGTVVDDAGTLGWTANGAACSARFEDGRLVGSCATEMACDLREIDAVRGGEGCSALPEGTFRTRGCGGASVKCTAAVQHGCSFMAACSIGPVPDLIVAGTVSEIGGLGHLEFNGANEFECYADAPSVEQLQSGEREAGEWRGTCERDDGARCRESGGFHGLQLFFEAN